MKGLNISIDDIVKKSIHAAEDAVKDVHNYESKHTKQRYYNLEDDVVDADDCTSIQINIPLGDCDIEIYDAPTTSYHFENYRSLFSNSTASIRGTVSNDTLLLEPTD